MKLKQVLFYLCLECTQVTPDVEQDWGSSIKSSDKTQEYCLQVALFS